MITRENLFRQAIMSEPGEKVSVRNGFTCRETCSNSADFQQRSQLNGINSRTAHRARTQRRTANDAAQQDLQALLSKCSLTNTKRTIVRRGIYSYMKSAHQVVLINALKVFSAIPLQKP